MSEIISNKSNNVQAKNVDVRAHNLAGGALTVTNDLVQTSGSLVTVKANSISGRALSVTNESDQSTGDLVSITGLAGQSALNVSATLQGGLNLLLQTVAVPGAGAAAIASRISTSAGLVLLNKTTNADDRAYLPSPTSVSDGKFYIIQTDGTGCELSAEGDGSTATTINTVEVTTNVGAYAKELKLAASSTFIAVKTGANAWTVTPGAAAPDG